MTIGIIGAGEIGQAFAKHVARAGYEVILSNSRGAESLTPLVRRLGSNVKAGSVQEAAATDIIFLAVPWQHLTQVATEVQSWEERIVIDPTNAIIPPDYQLPDFGGKTSSEVVTSLLPGARLVKAFNTLTPEVLARNPQEAGGRRVIFFSGNDTAAKTIVAGVIDAMGFAGVDLGGLADGGKLQQFPGGPLPDLNLIKLD